MSRHGGVNTSEDAIAPVTVSEWRWLLLAMLLGAAIRLMYLDRVAVEHFDEGVYAANVWFGADEGYQYPLRQFYAPPLLPTVIEWCYVLWGMTGMSPPAWLPMVPSLLCGIATIPSAWWIARRWFGPTAGYAAMWLVALNEFHASYSRTALTDVPVTLAILWAVFAAWKLLLNPTIKAGLLTGALTAIAWWLKYSGWLPLAILLVGGAVFQCLIRPEERRWKAWAFATGVAVLTAGVLWIPVYRDCLAVGGYSAVAGNHRGYIQGLSHWWENFDRQADHFGHYSALTFISFIWVIVPRSHFRWRTDRSAFIFWSLLAVIFVCRLAFTGGLWDLVLLAALLQVGGSVVDWFRQRLVCSEIASHALLSTWFFGLAVMTPLYQPYPRLLLPWWMAATLLTAVWTPRFAASLMEDISSRVDCGHPAGLWHRLRRIVHHPHFRMLLIVAATLNVTLRQPDLSTRENRREIRDATALIADQLRPHSDTAIVSVYGLPPVVIALRERGVAAVVSAGPEAAARLDGSWLVVSSDADRDSTWNEQWPKVADRFELVITFPTNPSSIVRLDNGPMPNDPPPVKVRLYRRR